LIDLGSQGSTEELESKRGGGEAWERWSGGGMGKMESGREGGNERGREGGGEKEGKRGRVEWRDRRQDKGGWCGVFWSGIQ
ncbi:hypothetical protein CLOM_g19507, partial [Closterium sp. NIES-68]